MRMVDAAEAVAGIRSGEQIWVHAAAATPSVLLDALVARADELHDVKVVHFHSEGPGPHLAPEMAGHFFHRALFIGPNARAAVNEGRAEYIPAFLSDVPDCCPARHPAARRGAGQRVAARPSRLLLAGHVGHRDAGRDPGGAKTVIAQINAAMPRTLGDSFVHVDDIDLGVEVDVPPYAHRARARRRSRATDR